MTGSPLNYKFQEQELQETGFYSFKWRQYMPDVGRFFNVDPLSEKYAYQSHYNFSENRVINSREIEGLESFDNYDDPYEWGDRVGLDRDSYSVEWQDNGRSEIVQNIEEVVITQSKEDFCAIGLIEDLTEMIAEFIDDNGNTQEDYPSFYRIGDGDRGWDTVGRDYEGWGDDLKREGDRVHTENMDNWQTPTPSPNGTGFAWGFSAIAEAIKNLFDFGQRVSSPGEKLGNEGASKDTLIEVPWQAQYPYGDSGIRLEDTVKGVTVEKNDKNEYGYSNNPTVREAIDAEQDKINQNRMK